MTDMEMDLIMAKAEVLSLQKIAREQSDMIANQRSHIAALQREIENLRQQNKMVGDSDG